MVGSGGVAPTRAGAAALPQAVRLNTNIKTESFLSQCGGHRGCWVHDRPRRGALGAPRWRATVTAQPGLLTGKGSVGAAPVRSGVGVVGAPLQVEKGKVCGGEFRERSA